VWEGNAEAWVRWARAPGHYSYRRFHARQFFELIPLPGRLTVDIGCGEGRVARDLFARGHRVVALDASVHMAQATAAHKCSQPALVADAAALPLRAGCADLAVAFMVLQDVEDLPGSVAEMARVLSAGGRLCLAVVHPINSAGRFAGERDHFDAPFVIAGSYLEDFRYRDEIERDGLAMEFHSVHRPLEAYFAALERAGFVTESVREVSVEDPADRWHRLPLFLDMRVRRPCGSEHQHDCPDGGHASREGSGPIAPMRWRDR
jgi:SAM-dependent methyltransferase